MRDSLQPPTRGGLKRPQPLRPWGIKGKFPDIKLHGRWSAGLIAVEERKDRNPRVTILTAGLEETEGQKADEG